MTNEGTGRRISRRAVLGAAGAVVAGAVTAVGGILRWRGGDRHQPVQPSPSPWPYPTVTPTPTPAPIDVRRHLEPVPGAFAIREWDAGAAIDWTAGFFFMDRSTGRVTGYQVADPAGASLAARYTTDPLGQIVVAESSKHRWLLRRADGAGFRWERDRLEFSGAGPGLLLFEEMRPGTIPTQHTGRYILTDLALGERLRFALPVPRPYTAIPAFFSPDGAKALLSSTGDDGIQRLHRVDLQTGTSKLILDPQRANLAPPERLSPPRSQGDPVVVLSPVDDLIPGKQLGIMERSVWPLDKEPSEGHAYYRFDWDGNILSRIEGALASYSVTVSHDGDFVAVQTDLLPVTGDPFEIPISGWPAVVIEDAHTREPLFRVRSAALLYGDFLPRHRWLSIAPAFTAQVRVPGPDGELAGPWYAVISAKETRYSPEQGAIRLLPKPPPLPDHWFNAPRNFAPVPSPSGLFVFSFGHYALDSDKGAGWVVPDIGADGPGHHDPWLRDGSAMVFTLPHGGHDGAQPYMLIPPKVEYPPFSTEMRFVAARAGRLNLRAAPAPDAPVVDVLTYGRDLTLIGAAGVPDHVVRTFDPPRFWLRVGTTGPNAQVGWVAAEYLDWA